MKTEGFEQGLGFLNLSSCQLLWDKYYWYGEASISTTLTTIPTVATIATDSHVLVILFMPDVSSILVAGTVV